MKGRFDRLRPKGLRQQPVESCGRSYRPTLGSHHGSGDDKNGGRPNPHRRDSRSIRRNLQESMRPQTIQRSEADLQISQSETGCSEPTLGFQNSRKDPNSAGVIAQFAHRPPSPHTLETNELSLSVAGLPIARAFPILSEGPKRLWL